MNWRPASKRPRNGKRVVAVKPWFGDGVIVGSYSDEHDQLICDRQQCLHWSYIELWIPEDEHIKAARAAAKGEAK